MMDENKDKMLKITGAAPEISWLCRDEGRKVRVHMAGLGDVGQNVAIGLTTLGGEKISGLGLYDLNEMQCRRMQTELSQIADPFTGRVFPHIKLLKKEELFDCDVFLFCATRSVPDLNSGITDVRMAQYAANKPIVESYAGQAAEDGYRRVVARRMVVNIGEEWHSAALLQVFLDFVLELIEAAHHDILIAGRLKLDIAGCSSWFRIPWICCVWLPPGQGADRYSSHSRRRSLVHRKSSRQPAGLCILCTRCSSRAADSAS